MIDVEVEDEAWERDLPDVGSAAERSAQMTLSASPSLHPGQGDRAGAALTILLTDDDTVRALNVRFRGKDGATNVLSFPAPQSAAPHLGDVALAHGVCTREATAQGKGLGDHLAHLVVHGVLHLLGYDHQADAQADVMEDVERRVLSRLGVADPYGSAPGDV